MAKNDLLSVLQEITQANVKGMKPTDLCFGTVATASPLSIVLEDTMLPLPAEVLVLCDSVVDRSVTISGTDSDGDAYSFTVPLSVALQAGERVIMLRVSAGQRFVVLSRVQGA